MKKSVVLPALCLLVATFTVAASPGPVQTVPAAGTYVVNDDRVNVRAAPDAVNGRVIGRLNKGAVVEVTEMTFLAYAVQDMRAAWFHITKPDGWIYGFFLDPSQ